MKPPKIQQGIQGTPVARFTYCEYRGVGKGLDLWSFVGNPRGNPHLGDDLLYDKEATKYATKGKVFCVESHRVGNFPYANKISRDDWGQRIHFGEVEADYTHEDEFRDAVVMYRQPNMASWGKKKGRHTRGYEERYERRWVLQLELLIEKLCA